MMDTPTMLNANMVGWFMIRRTLSYLLNIKLFRSNDIYQEISNHKNTQKHLKMMITHLCKPSCKLT